MVKLNQTMKIYFRKVLFLTLLLYGPIAFAVEIRSEFSPPVISLGTQSQYKIIIINGGNSSLRGEIPVVQGLEIEKNNPMPSTHVSIVNGKQEIRKSYGFTATPRKEGTYTVPAWTLSMDGENYTVPQATLKVVPPGEEFNNSLFMKVLPEKTDVYVGESIPTVVKLYLRGDISASILGEGINKTGDAFAQSDIPEQFQQRTETIEGQTYKVAMWPITLTPVKPGDHSVLYTLDLMVELPDQNRMRRRDPFDGFGSLFDDMLGRRNRKELSLTSQEVIFNVKEIPTGNRPEGFTGAVGEFMTSTSLDTNTVKVGEPITLTVEMTGEGNFSRILAPEIPENENFKLYPSKTSFEQAHDTGIHGTKKFEYIIIPKDDTITETPAIPFTYFDPDTKSFQDITIQSIPIQVSKNPDQIFNRPTLPQNTEQLVSSGNKSSGDLTEDQDSLSIYPIKQQMGKTTDQIVAPVYRFTFWLLQTVMAVFCLLIYVILKYKKLQNDPAYRIHARNKGEIKNVDQMLQQAFNQNNSREYFENLDKWLRLNFAHYFSDRDSKTLNENLIAAKMTELQFSNAEIQLVIDAMLKHQSIKFSGGIESSENLEKWNQRLNSFKQAMKKRK